jgi:cytochrome P450
MSEAIQNMVAPQSSIQAQLEIVNQFAEEIIMQRKKSLDEGYIAEDSEPKNDILSRFMETRNHHNQPLSNKELRDIVLNFIIAGRDTTAQALSWTIYNLILYPRIEKRLLEEINECITDGLMEDPKALYNVVTRMVYAHAM